MVLARWLDRDRWRGCCDRVGCNECLGRIHEQGLLSTHSRPRRGHSRCGAGTVVVYYEGDGTPTSDDLRLRVYGPDGQAITTEPYPGKLLYDYKQGVAKAIAMFEASSAGPYRIEASNSVEDASSIAVGHDLTNVVPTIPWALGLALIAVIAGISLSAFVYRNRSQT